MKRALATVLIALSSSAAFAHPMGNFSVNRYARLEPSPRRLGLLYIVDFAEIPTFQSLSEFSGLASERDPGVLGAAPDAMALRRSLERAWEPGLALRVDGRRVRLRTESTSLSFFPGAGGLPTMKLTMRLAAVWPPEAARAGDAEIAYEDGNAPERLGWREVVLRADAGLSVREATADSRDVSDALTRYPADPTADIPNVVSARFRAEGLVAATAAGPLPEARRPESSVPPASVSTTPAPPAAAHTVVPAPVSPAPMPAGRRFDRFAALVAARQLTFGLVALSLAIAFGLGGLHALSPGHGKTIVAAYLVGSRGTARHAVLLGAVVTASHTVGVFLLGLVTLALSRAIVPEKLYPAIQFLSGIAIVAIGASLFVRRLARAAPHDHSHAVEVPESAPTASALLALGVSGGILPCPSALVVLLSAIALHRIGFGLFLIVAFSAGLASVLSGIGILVVRAGRVLARFERAGVWARRIPAFSALLIGLLGVAIAARAFPDLHHAFFSR